MNFLGSGPTLAGRLAAFLTGAGVKAREGRLPTQREVISS